MSRKLSKCRWSATSGGMNVKDLCYYGELTFFWGDSSGKEAVLDKIHECKQVLIEVFHCIVIIIVLKHNNIILFSETMPCKPFKVSNPTRYVLCV